MRGPRDPGGDRHGREPEPDPLGDGAPPHDSLHRGALPRLERAAIQLIVYAGAIVVLFLFVIMLLGPSATPSRDQRGVFGRTFGGVLFAGAALGAGLLVVRGAKPMFLPPPEPDFGGVEWFGRVLFTDALVPFELSSALLMVAVIGAVAVAKGKKTKVMPKEGAP
jgi:NADH-ubiquinone/plastoquinone oxidoreductase subunit 6